MTLDHLTKAGRSGINSTSNYDTHNIHSTGIITATAFHGDGSNLTGVGGDGIGTPLGDVDPLSSIFKTPETLNITGVTTITSDADSGHVAYCRHGKIVISGSGSLHVSAGTTFKTLSLIHI